MPVILIALLFVLSAPISSVARIWTVPADAPTIKAGLDSAVAGDTVSVSCGTYLEYEIPMKPSVVLRSMNGDPDCVTISPGQHHGISCFGATTSTIIEGLTISGANLELGVGGGMIVTGSPTIRNCAFLGNTAVMGGGIDASGGTLTLTGCTFSDNTSTDIENGFGAAIRTSAVAIIRNCTFTNNRARFGGAIYGNTLIISGSAFSNNTARKDGGAITCGSATIDSSTFFYNELIGGAGGGFPGGHGGAISTGGGPHLINACQFVGNRVGGGYPATYGGTIYTAGSEIELKHCLLANSAVLGEGGASYGGTIAVSGGSIKLTNCTISGGKATLGGGLYLSAGAIGTIDKTIISFSREGSAVYCDSGDGQAFVSCSDITGNSGGDWVGCIAGQNGMNGNFSANPLFCDTAAVDYRLTLSSPCLSSGGCGNIGAHFSCSGTAVPGTGPELGSQMILSVSPNPSRGTISCVYHAPLSGAASLKVFSAAGRLLRSESIEAAAGHVIWDGTDSGGRAAPSGIYFLRIAAGRHQDMRKVTLIR